MKLLARSALVLCAGLLLWPGCANTSIVSSWKDPAVSQIQFKRVVVIAPNRDPAMRRSIEDELAAKLGPNIAVPSYTLLPESTLDDEQGIRKRIKELGFDGAVVFHVVSVKREATWVPGTYGGPYYAFGGWPAYDPGYVQTDTVVRVDTNIYSVPDDRLVWAAASRTIDPGNTRRLVDDVVKRVAKEMRKEGLVVTRI